jgi:hypothetical protein
MMKLTAVVDFVEVFRINGIVVMLSMRV